MCNKVFEAFLVVLTIIPGGLWCPQTFVSHFCLSVSSSAFIIDVICMHKAFFYFILFIFNIFVMITSSIYLNISD